MSVRFAATNVNKIMTIEACGIAPAIMTGYLMDLPVVFAKKKSPKTIQNALSTTVHSFTKDRDYEVVISTDFLTPNDNILFVDDFLAYGNAAIRKLSTSSNNPEQTWWEWDSLLKKPSKMDAKNLRHKASE